MTPREATMTGVADHIEAEGVYAVMASWHLGDQVEAVPRPLVDRRQVYQWYRRQTRNYRKDPFPREVRSHRDPDWAFKTVRYFDLDAVERWYEAGVSGPNGKGWIFPRRLAS